MAEQRGQYSYMEEWLTQIGYNPDTRMTSKVNEYFGWYTARNDWYQYQERRNEQLFKMNRETLYPAVLVSDAWADLLMNEKLEITSEDAAMQAVIDDHFNNFGVAHADFVSRAFALGTGAWAINVFGVDNDGMVHPDADIRIEEYDATQILPLTWSATNCTQCAFATRVEYEGQDYDQCQAHVIIDGTYHILTQLFDTKKHTKVYLESVLPDFNTRSTFPTFAIVKPAVSNTHFNYCAMGASVYDRAYSAIKATDEALTSHLVHMRVARPKIFVSDTMIKKTMKKDPNGKTITKYSAFGEADDIMFKVSQADEGQTPLNVVQPDLRVEENTSAINAGLKMLSISCGLGDNYWQWDHAGGLKTATEVVSDSSMLARTLKKHQNALGKALERIVSGVAGVCSSICNTSVSPDAGVCIDFDDSVITDTQTDKNMALTEISMLGVPELKVRYLTRYCGFSEEEARAAVPSEAVIDTGF
jgi:A118 family predicted phage portal protein